MNLLESTRKLLESRLANGASVRDIVNESNGQIKFEWLRKFADETVKNPTFNRLQTLHDFLKKTSKSN